MSTAIVPYTGATHAPSPFDAGAGLPMHPDHRGWGILRCTAEFCASLMRCDLRAFYGPDRAEVIERHHHAEFEGMAIMGALRNYEAVMEYADRRNIFAKFAFGLYDHAIAKGYIL